MIRHTPGPWTLETVKTSVGVCHKVGAFPSLLAHRPTTYACVYEDGMHLWRVMDHMDSELLSNARVMASSPELLAFVKDFAEWWRDAGSVYYGPDARQEDEGLQHIAAKASALIAQAEGGQ